MTDSIKLNIILVLFALMFTLELFRIYATYKSIISEKEKTRAIVDMVEMISEEEKKKK